MPSQADLNKTLIKAASCRDIYTIRQLVHSGADVNSRNTEGRTALEMVSGYLDSAHARALLELGADIDDDSIYIDENLKALAKFTDSIYKLSLAPRPEVYNPVMDDGFVIERLYHSSIKFGVPSLFAESLNHFNLIAETKLKIVEKAKIAAYIHALIHLKPLNAAFAEISAEQQSFIIEKLRLRVQSGLISQLGLEKLYHYLKDQPALKALVDNAIKPLFDTNDHGIDGLYYKVNDCAEICLGFLLNLMNPESFPSESPFRFITMWHSYKAAMMVLSSCLNVFEQLILNQDPISSIPDDKLGLVAGAIEMLNTFPSLILSEKTDTRLSLWKTSLQNLIDPPQASGGSMGAAGASSSMAISRPKLQLKLKLRKPADAPAP